jgi:competence ComEA-like helix-hairpin-helix protein
VRLSEPAGRQLFEVNDLEVRVTVGEVVEDLGGGIAGTIIHGDDFVIRVILRQQGGQRLRHLDGFVARAQQDGDAGAVGVGQQRDALEPATARCRAPCDGHHQPTQRQQPENARPEEFHLIFSVGVERAGYPITAVGKRLPSSGRTRGADARPGAAAARLAHRAVVTRSPRTARAAVRFIGGGEPISDLKSQISKLENAAVVLIATNDNQVPPAARTLARLKKNWRGRVVLQASGALSSRVLAPLGKRGAAVGSLHPLYPFPKPLKVFPPGVVFGLEGDSRALKEALALVRSLKGEPMEVRSTEKALYHAAAALVAGHLLTLADMGVRALVRAGVRKSRARTVLVPLAQATLGWYARQGARAWTGRWRVGMPTRCGGIWRSSASFRPNTARPIAHLREPHWPCIASAPARERRSCGVYWSSPVFLRCSRLALILLGVLFSFAVLRAEEKKPAEPKVNINSATVEELAKLPGVGEVIAQRIVNHREKSGKFRKLEELLVIRGISKKKLDKLRPLITVGEEERKN